MPKFREEFDARSARLSNHSLVADALYYNPENPETVATLRKMFPTTFVLAISDLGSCRKNSTLEIQAINRFLKYHGLEFAFIRDKECITADLQMVRARAYMRGEYDKIRGSPVVDASSKVLEDRFLVGKDCSKHLHQFIISDNPSTAKSDDRVIMSWTRLLDPGDGSPGCIR